MDTKGSAGFDDDAAAAAPTVRALSTAGGYSQVYLVHTPSNSDSKDESDSHEVLFRCGNWMYIGRIQFGALRLTTSDLPILVPALQKQQGSLRYYCHSSAIPPSSDYALPLQFLAEAVEFFAEEVCSEGVDRELKKMASVFPWINDDSAGTYFELGLSPDLPAYMDNVGLVAAKTYTRGLIIVTVYAESSLFFVLSSGEGDQPLLDVRFPDVSRHGQGLHLATYPFTGPASPFRKLTLWHALDARDGPRVKDLPRVRTLNVGSRHYEQTYLVMKSSWDGPSATLSVHHDVLFRFGSWCYSGRVQLVPTIALSDLPFIIPALRIQQSRLDYQCDASSVPTTSPFAGALSYTHAVAPLCEAYIASADEVIEGIVAAKRACSAEGTEAAHIEDWMAGDPGDTFFEFSTQLEPRHAAQLKNIELIASKVYHASGVITISCYHEGTVYVVVQDGSKENPLLDSKFPDVSTKGQGLQLGSYGEWPLPFNPNLTLTLTLTLTEWPLPFCIY